MKNTKSKSQSWPMEYILGGIFVIAVVVLLSFGLQSRKPDSKQVALRPTGDTEATAARADGSRRLPEPEQLSVITQPLGATALEPAQVTGTTLNPDADALTVTAIGPEPMSFADAEASYHAGEFSLAAERFAAYTLVHPSNPWGHYMLGLSELRTGDAEASEAAFRRALLEQPEHLKALVNLGRVLMEQGRHEDALAVLAEAVAIDPASVATLRVRARALHNLGRSREALAAYEKVLDLDPTDAWSLNNLGLILIETERFDEALGVLALAQKLGDSVAVFQNNLAVALERCGHTGAAAQAYGRALALDENYEKARISLARVEGLAPDAERAPELGALADATAAAIADGRLCWATVEPVAGAEGDGKELPDEEPATLLSQVPPAETVF